MKMDLELWNIFLDHPSIYARSFLDLNTKLTSVDVDFYTDASANPNLGCGGICESNWFIVPWNERFINKYKSSINYLELYALTIAIYLWSYKFMNQNITIFCDNMSVVQMVNKSSSKCKNCMVLIRLIVLKSLTHNVKINVKHVPGKNNNFADWLSRLEYKKFRQQSRKISRKFDNKPMEIPQDLWPMEKLWLLNNYQSLQAITKKDQFDYFSTKEEIQLKEKEEWKPY